MENVKNIIWHRNGLGTGRHISDTTIWDEKHEKDVPLYSIEREAPGLYTVWKRTEVTDARTGKQTVDENILAITYTLKDGKTRCVEDMKAQ